MNPLPYKVGISPKLHIRGMIATRDIKKHEILEQCPVICIPKKEQGALFQTILQNYYFDWTKTHCAIVLGYGSLINHSFSPNASYRCDYKHKCLVFYAIKVVKRGDEVLVNYNGISRDTTPLPQGWVNFSK